MVEQLKAFLSKEWPGLLGVAGAVVAVVGRFAASPPPLGPTDWTQFGTFVVAVVIVIYFIALRRFGSRRHLSGLIALLVASLVACIASQFAYDSLYGKWTITSLSRVYVRADGLTPTAEAYARKAGLTEEQVLENSGYNNDVYPEDAVETRYHILAGVYIANLLVDSLAIFAVFFAIRATG